MSAALDTLLARLREEDPPRVWSLLVTLFGDAIAPRGGAVSSTTLNSITARLGIEPGAVRTALSRLARDGWIERERRGRHSHYSLSMAGRAPFAAASRRIYASNESARDTRPRLLAIGERERGDGRSGSAPDPAVADDGPADGSAIGRAALGITRHGSDGAAIELRGNLWLLVDEGEAQRERLRRQGYFVVGAELGPLPDWLAGRLGLPALAGDADALVARFGPLAHAPPPGSLEALGARLLLVHAWRRLLLRTPVLPPALQPPDWPLPATRRFVGTLYHALLPGSTRWLDEHGEGPTGALPPDVGEVGTRFLE